MIKNALIGSTRWLRVFKDGFGPSFWVFTVIAAVAGAACYYWQGPEAFNESLAEDVALLGTQPIEALIER